MMALGRWAHLASVALMVLASSSFGQPAAPAQAAPLDTDTTGDDAHAQSGERAGPGTRATAAATPWRFGLDYLLLEAGGFTNSDQASSSWTGRASAFVLHRPNAAWELRAGARVDGVKQAGGDSAHSDGGVLLTDTYVRWRDGGTRLTMGTQTMVWGRVDELPVIDRLSRADLSRLPLDDLRERRLATPALRLEQNWDDVKLDAVWLPLCRCALLPDVRSAWSPVNQSTGEILGIPPSPQLADVVRNASLSDDDGGSGGGGVRITRTGETFDVGLTLARTRQSAPYFELDPGTLALRGVHPYNNFAGVDAEWSTDAATWRTELGYTGSVPLTSPQGAMQMADAIEWAGGVEFFPGGRDTRVNLQLLARSLRTDEAVLELKHYANVNGAVESSFGDGRWKAELKFAVGLNVRDVYLAPSLTYVGWEPYEVYVAGFVFDGTARTIGGFYRQQDMIAVGLRRRF